MKRIMVDMSVTLLHHGHVRLLKKAAELGRVVVALTTDECIRESKGYEPELDYQAREEVVAALRYVDEVVPSPWIVDEEFMDKHGCQLLVHGDDNFNHVRPERLIIFPRTEGVSSSGLRERVLDILVALNLSNKKSTSAEKVARMMIETIKKEFLLE